MITNISGLTSGFAYVVGNGNADFGDQKVKGTNFSRQDVFGFLITTSFILSLAAVMLSATLYAVFNILSPRHIVRFVRKWYWLVGMQSFM